MSIFATRLRTSRPRSASVRVPTVSIEGLTCGVVRYRFFQRSGPRKCVPQTCWASRRETSHPLGVQTSDKKKARGHVYPHGVGNPERLQHEWLQKKRNMIRDADACRCSNAEGVASISVQCGGLTMWLTKADGLTTSLKI